MEKNPQAVTPAVDLLAPANRFDSSFRLYGRLHRWHLLIRRYWWVIGLIMVLVLVPVYIYSSGLPPAYQTKARMWLAGKLNLSEGRIYTEELVDYLATQSELLKSSTIQQRALAKVRSQFPNFVAVNSPSGSKSGFHPVQEIKIFIQNMMGGTAGETNNALEASPFTVKVTEASKSSVLDLRAIGPEPRSTRAFLNSLMEEYFTFKKEHRDTASDQALSSVKGEVHELAAELKAQQEKLHMFQSSNNVVFLQEQGSSAGGFLGQLNRQIATLRTQLSLLERLDPEQWVDEESRRAAGNAGEPGDNKARETLASLAGPQGDLFKATQQMQLLKAKREELSKFLQPLHPKITKLNEDIATQERLVKISRDEALNQLNHRRQALGAEIKNLEAAFKEWDVKAIEASRRMADYDGMKLDMQRLQNAYDRLFGVMQTVDVGKTLDQENIGILEAASPAKRIPRMLWNMLIATVGAGLLCLVGLHALGVFDDRFTSPEELARHLSAEVVGQIPDIWLRSPKGKLGLQYLERQQFEFLESFRNLRSAMLFMGNSGPKPKTILITSSVPREGKSTVSLYLSATLALGGSRVLLIDADMRRSSLHKFFSAKAGPGLAEVLSRELGTTCGIVPSMLENLSLLPAGNARRNPGELVLSPEWTRMLHDMYPLFDYIVIDSPPVLATDDAAVLAPRADGVLMVVRASYTSARMAQRGLDLLRRRRARVLGLVFNRTASSHYEYHYYQQYKTEYAWRPQPSSQQPSLAFGPTSGGSDTHVG
jgi:polysaccharide biosynthesis transport protein